MTPSETTISAIRFGYGFHPDQHPPRGPDDLMRHLLRPDNTLPSGPTVQERHAALKQFIKEKKAKTGDNTARRMIRGMVNRDLTSRVLAPIVSTTGFFERLATFWSDHFTVAMRGQSTRVIVGRYEADAIRPHIAGNFRDMLRASATHQAMLMFLNQIQSIGPNSKAGKRNGRGLNENLAREIIELHTLGVGAAYTQKDIQQFALLLTGLWINPRTGETVFNQRRAEPGEKIILGQRFGRQAHVLADISAALDHLARHPATAQHIARKLAIHFVSDSPPQSLIKAMANAFTANDGALRPVYQAMLEHTESWRTFGNKVKQPFDFVVSSIRAAGGDRARIWRAQNGMQAVRALRFMNQPVLAAPGPDGWPEGARDWINAQGLTVRLKWASDLAQAMGQRADPRAFLTTALSDTAREETVFAVTNAAEKWEGVALALASPEFNRR
ncbi:MAG: DUF1800 domain-containing protein [Pikeienuella sp.]